MDLEVEVRMLNFVPGWFFDPVLTAESFPSQYPSVVVPAVSSEGLLLDLSALGLFFLSGLFHGHYVLFELPFQFAFLANLCILPLSFSFLHGEAF